jgi:P2 family phage contractile tail tube protein
MALVLIQEAVSLFVTDTGPDNGKHLTLESVQVPTLEEKSQDYYAGGAIGELAVGGLGLSKLEVTFKCKGHDPQILSQFGLGSVARRPFTVYGLLRDKKTNKAIETKGVIEGRLAKINSDEQSRGALIGHDYMIHEIVYYELSYDKKQKYLYDWFNSIWSVDGVVQNQDMRDILRIA